MKSFATLVFLCAAASIVTDAVVSPVKPLSTFGGYKVIFRSGDQPGASPLPIGTLIDVNGNPVTAALACTSIGCASVDSTGEAVHDISANPDFTSLQVTPNGNMFLLTQFEASSPAAFYVTKLSQNKMTGELTAVHSKPTDWSAPELQGLWIPCGGSVTPWGTHAGGEEYEPDAYCVEQATSINGNEATSLKKCLGDESGVTEFMRFYGYYANNITIEAIKTHFNPYLYGHAFEAQLVDDDGNVKITKHMVMGRHSYELWYAMPDQKTTYSTDDGTNTAFWKFVADTAGDMSAGTLYGAKLTQVNDVYGGEFNISWINLGHGTQAEIEQMVVTDKVTFSQIFDVMPFTAAIGCIEGYKSISKRDNGLGAQCLKLKAGMEKAAAFLESRRYLAYLGGSVELSKFEGITHDKGTGKLYAAMSQIRYGMENNTAKGKASMAYDEGGSNDVRVPYNPCGCIYGFDLTPEFDATRMYGELCGVSHAATARYGTSKCDERGISEPDNIVSIGSQGTLIIGEDTNENQIDSMWSYDLATKLLTRIFSSPYGAETTAPYWFPNTKGRFNGWSYLGGSIQHPYGESDQTKAKEPEATGLAGYVGAWAFSASDFARGEKLQFVAIPPSTTNAMKHNVQASAAGYTVPRKPVVDAPIKKSTF